MNGYMIHHEAAINRNAGKAQALAGEYEKLIAEMEELTRMKDWDSPAAESQKAEINAIIAQARDAVAALRNVSSKMYDFTETHKTWLEDAVDAITGGNS